MIASNTTVNLSKKYHKFLQSLYEKTVENKILWYRIGDNGERLKTNVDNKNILIFRKDVYYYLDVFIEGPLTGKTSLANQKFYKTDKNHINVNSYHIIKKIYENVQADYVESNLDQLTNSLESL